MVIVVIHYLMTVHVVQQIHVTKDMTVLVYVAEIHLQIVQEIVLPDGFQVTRVMAGAMMVLGVLFQIALNLTVMMEIVVMFCRMMVRVPLHHVMIQVLMKIVMETVSMIITQVGQVILGVIMVVLIQIVLHGLMMDVIVMMELTLHQNAMKLLRLQIYFSQKHQKVQAIINIQKYIMQVMMQQIYLDIRYQVVITTKQRTQSRMRPDTHYCRIITVVSANQHDTYNAWYII